MPRTSWVFTLAIAGAALAPLAAVPARAAQTNLRAAALRPVDMLPGFTKSHIKVYAHYAATMRVRTVLGGSTVQTRCSVPQSFAQFGWRSGLVQGFDSGSLSTSLRVCAYMFSSGAHAHDAFSTLSGTTIKPFTTGTLGQPLPTAHIGDEALGMQRGMKECSCDTTNTTVIYDMVFRRGNAVVDLWYSGSPRLSATGFVDLVRGTDKRLS